MTRHLDGRLHIYNRPRNLVCFESGSLSGQNVLIFYGGLGTGLFSLPVLSRLSFALPHGWSLVQATSRSSHQGFLTSALKETAEDMRDVEMYFRGLGKTGRMVFMDSSKGCNDVLRFFDVYGDCTTVDAGILISPTCGRESMLQSFTEEEIAESLTIAAAQIEAGNGAFPFPSELQGEHNILQVCKGMHANVWHAIMGPGGPGENFSSTSSDEQLSKLFESCRRAEKCVCILTAGDDEAVPRTVDKEMLLQRLVRAAQGPGSVAFGRVIPGANHEIEQESAQELSVSSIVEYLHLTSRKKT